MRLRHFIFNNRIWLIATVAIAGVGIVVSQRQAGVAHSGRGNAGGEVRSIYHRHEPGPREVASGFPIAGAHAYDFSEKARVTTTQGQTVVDVSLAGPLTLSVLRTEPSILVRGQFLGECSSMADGIPGDAAELNAASHEPFFLEFGREGSFQRVFGDAGVPPFIGRIWSALGEYLQFTPSDGQSRWEAREQDAAGEYIAGYEFREPGRIEKRKLRYEEAGDGIPLRSIVRFDALFQLDDARRLESLTLNEHIRVESAGEPLPGFEGITELSLKRGGTIASDLMAWLAEAAGAVDLGEAARNQERAARDRARIGGLSIADIFSRLAALDNQQAGDDDRERAGRAFMALVSLLRQDPSQLAVVRAHIEKRGPLTHTLMAALRDASTPESQELLAELAKPGSLLDPEERMAATRSLSHVAEPTGETVQALTSLQSDPDVGVQATYGLGSALHRLQGQDPGQAATVRDTLLRQLDEGSSSERPGLLTALGNAGDPETIESIKRYLEDESAAVRAAAAQALRRIPGQEADALLASLCTDTEPEVRYSAADAISERIPSTVLVQALAGLALSEPVFRTRARAVNTLARWLPQAPPAAEALGLVAQHDENEDLRHTAELALQRR